MVLTSLIYPIKVVQNVFANYIKTFSRLETTSLKEL